MNPEFRSACDGYRDEWLQLVGGDSTTADLSPSAAEHLESCAVCRTTLDESRELFADLRRALRPTPLVPALHRRICDRVAMPDSDSGALRERGPWALVATAAAAGFLAFVFSPDAETASSRAETLLASHRDVEEIVAAYGLLQWNASTEYTLGLVGSRIDDLERAAGRESDAPTLLPWTTDDDWDAPAEHADAPAGGMATPRRRLFVDGGLKVCSTCCREREAVDGIASEAKHPAWYSTRILASLAMTMCNASRSG